MTTPTKHLEIFDEFSHCLHWELDKDKMVIDATPTEIKQHLIQTVISVLEEQLQALNNPSYCGVLDSNERRRGYDIGVTESIDSLTTTLSSWKALL